MTHLFLIRHGRSVWNAEGRIQGHADPPLDDMGREQARRLAGRLQGGAMVALYTSPLQRARETADIIGQALGVPVVADERLKEYGIGVVTGLTFEQVAEQYPDVARRLTAAEEHLDIPGEEESPQFRARVVAAFDDILARLADGPVGVVAHGGTFGDYLNHLIGLVRRHSPFRFSNGSLTIVEVDPVRPRIVLLNDTCHLRGEA